MTFKVPKSRASIGQNRFEFEFPGSTKKYSIPLLKFLKPSLAVAFEEMTEIQAVVAIFEEYFPKQDLFSKFEDSEQFEAWMNQWQEESGVEVGESDASSDS